MSTIESRFSNCGILITGDFNRLDTSRFRNAFKLTQIVKFHTRGNQTLDLVLTNIKGFYEEPIKRPAFGLSDNASVELQPLSRCKTQPSKRSIITRDQRECHRVAPSSYLDWPCKEQGYMCRENAEDGGSYYFRYGRNYAPERKVGISE